MFNLDLAGHFPSAGRGYAYLSPDYLTIILIRIPCLVGLDQYHGHIHILSPGIMWENVNCYIRNGQNYRRACAPTSFTNT